MTGIACLHCGCQLFLRTRVEQDASVCDDCMKLAVRRPEPGVAAAAKAGAAQQHARMEAGQHAAIVQATGTATAPGQYTPAEFAALLLHLAAGKSVEPRDLYKAVLKAAGVPVVCVNGRPAAVREVKQVCWRLQREGLGYYDGKTFRAEVQ